MLARRITGGRQREDMGNDLSPLKGPRFSEEGTYPF